MASSTGLIGTLYTKKPFFGTMGLFAKVKYRNKGNVKRLHIKTVLGSNFGRSKLRIMF